MHVLVAGVGWLGREIAARLIARGDRVTGVRRSRGDLEDLRRAGLEPLSIDLSDWHAARTLPRDVEAVIACQAPRSDDAAGYRTAYVEANRNLLELAREWGVRSYVYTGSTGVFGQTDGSDVDETTPVAPVGPTAQILAEAERIVAAADGVPTRIVRLSGLYGPGRTGVIDRVRSGSLAIVASEDPWMNWCHLEDAAATVIAAVDRGAGGGVYHASDAAPARRSAVVAWIAERLAIEPRRTAPSAPGDRRAPDRRIVAEWTRKELGIELRHPSFREGLEPFLPRGWPA